MSSFESTTLLVSDPRPPGIEPEPSSTAAPRATGWAMADTRAEQLQIPESWRSDFRASNLKWITNEWWLRTLLWTADCVLCQQQQQSFIYTSYLLRNVSSVLWAGCAPQRPAWLRASPRWAGGRGTAPGRTAAAPGQTGPAAPAPKHNIFAAVNKYFFWGNSIFFLKITKYFFWNNKMSIFSEITKYFCWCKQIFF